MLIIDKDLCVGCGICESACPFGVISVVDGCAVVGDGCTLCGSCVETCDSGALKIEGAEKILPWILPAGPEFGSIANSGVEPWLLFPWNFWA